MTDIYRNSGGKDNMAVDRLDENRIRQYLSPEYSGTKIIVYDVTDSTNKQAKIYAKSKEDGDEIIAFVAEEQTEGRGRRGRSFYSPKATGVYLSLLLDVREQPDTVQILTVATAVAVRESLNELFGIMPGIKWVNDLYFEGRKICGILAEAVNNTENGNIEKVVVGVGINCNTTEFPKEIEDVAGAFSTERIDRNELVAKLIGKIHEKVKKTDRTDVMTEYKRYSFMTGKKVKYIQCEKEVEGTVLDINENGNLVVRRTDGIIDVLYSGEVSVKVSYDGRNEK